MKRMSERCETPVLSRLSPTVDWTQWMYLHRYMKHNIFVTWANNEWVEPSNLAFKCQHFALCLISIKNCINKLLIRKKRPSWAASPCGLWTLWVSTPILCHPAFPCPIPVWDLLHKLERQQGCAQVEQSPGPKQRYQDIIHPKNECWRISSQEQANQVHFYCSPFQTVPLLGQHILHW